MHNLLQLISGGHHEAQGVLRNTIALTVARERLGIEKVRSNFVLRAGKKRS